MNVFVQESMSEQAVDANKRRADLEEARTWATTARVAATNMKTDIEDVRTEMQEMENVIKEVLQVHRDRIDGVEEQLSVRDDWARSVQDKIDEISLEEVWEDLTAK